MEESILYTIKSMLGVSDVDDAFDNDILVNINSIFSTLYQIGVGEDDGHYFVLNGSETWKDVFKETDLIDFIKMYTYMKVRYIFDPPTNSSILQALKEQINEIEYRILLQADPSDYFLDNDEMRANGVLSDKDVENIWKDIMGRIPGTTSGDPLTNDELTSIWKDIMGSIPGTNSGGPLTDDDLKIIWKEIMGRIPESQMASFTDDEIENIWKDVIGNVPTSDKAMSRDDINMIWNEIMS